MQRRTPFHIHYNLNCEYARPTYKKQHALHLLIDYIIPDVRSLAVDSMSRVDLDSQKRSGVANYSRIGAYRTCTSVKDFRHELCAQNSGDVSRIIKVITIEQAYAVRTIQA